MCYRPNGQKILHKEVLKITKTLKFMPYATAKVKIENDKITLISYWTDVIYITCDNWLEITGTYSRTTISHISAFLKEYAPHLTYQDVKYLFQHHLKYNLETGEVISL